MSTNEPPTSTEGVPPADGWFDAPSTPSATPGDSAASPRGGTSARTWIAAGVGAVALTAGAIVGINVASSSAEDAATTPSGAASGQFPGGGVPGGRGGGTVGTIASVDGSTLRVSTMDGGTVDVTTSSDTDVVISEEGELDDVAVGDHLLVVGTASGDQIAAASIVDTGDQELDGPGARPDGDDDGGRPAGVGGVTHGVVTATGSDSITLEAEDGSTVTVTTSDVTTVAVQRAGAVSDLHEGDTVMVRGEMTDGTVAATEIREGELGAPGGFRGGMPPSGGPDNGAGQGGMPGQGSSGSSGSSTN